MDCMQENFVQFVQYSYKSNIISKQNLFLKCYGKLYC